VIEARIPHNSLTHGPEEREAVARVVASGYWAGGPALAGLESALAAAAGVQHAVGVASGLAALRLALIALDIRAGDEIIVPAFSCVALPTAALAIGARPVPVDVSPGTWNIDVAAVKAALTRSTRAIVAVHTFGLPAEIEELRSLGLPVIEDCAHCFGIEARGGPIGSLGEVAILSFYATKLMGGGEGGAVLTNREELARRIRQQRSYVDQPADGTRLNDKMSDIVAALATCQLERLPRMIEARERIAAAYNDAFSRSPKPAAACVLPVSTERRVWYRYALESRTLAAQDVVARLAAEGVEADLPVWDWLKSGAFPVARRAYASLVSLPIYPTLTASQVQRVSATVPRVFD
jgi:perosamine synthetase